MRLTCQRKLGRLTVPQSSGLTVALVKSAHRLIRVVFIPVVGLRVIEEDEMLGLELTQHGEKACNE